MIYETNYIMHYNKNHDKLGRFAKGTSSGFYSKSTAKKLNKIDKMMDTRSDKKIAKELRKVTRDIMKDNYKFSGDLDDRLIEVSRSKTFNLDDYVKIRDDLEKRRDQAKKILESSLGRIGERDLGDHTVQKLGMKTIKQIDNIMKYSMLDYDRTLDKLNDALSMDYLKKYY